MESWRQYTCRLKLGFVRAISDILSVNVPISVPILLTWLRYCRYGVKLLFNHSINRSINRSINQSYLYLAWFCILRLYGDSVSVTFSEFKVYLALGDSSVLTLARSLIFAPRSIRRSAITSLFSFTANIRGDNPFSCEKNGHNSIVIIFPEIFQNR